MTLILLAMSLFIVSSCLSPPHTSSTYLSGTQSGSIIKNLGVISVYQAYAMNPSFPENIYMIFIVTYKKAFQNKPTLILSSFALKACHST